MPRLGTGVPLVGRRAELEQLRAALARADEGSACGVLLSGDAGVGKTRLIAELHEHAASSGALVLTGGCIDIAEDGLPYLPFADALLPLATSEQPDVVAAVRTRPALGRLLPQLAPLQMPGDERAPVAVDDEMRRGAFTQDLGQLQLFEAVLGALAELAERRVVVLIIEDLHWADSSTRDLVSFLLARLRAQRLLVIASYRSEDVHRRHPLRPLIAQLARVPSVERLDLAPLPESDARSLVAVLSDEPLKAELATSIIERAEGNAFFLEELLASCVECDGIPAALADVLLSRLERLPTAAQRVVRTASVADRGVSHLALSEVLDFTEAQLDEALREAVQHNVLVVEDGFYAFRHALLREAVYADLLPGERARIHRAYAKRLIGKTGRRHATLLAYHSLESNDLPTALEASLRAATEAEQRGAPGSALRSVEQALRIWDAVPPEQRPEGVDELRLLDMATSLAGRSGEVERAVSYARSMAELLESGRVEVGRRRAARVWRRLAQALQATDGTAHEAPSVIERAWQLVADDEPSESKAWVQATRASILRVAGDRTEALASARRAIADAEAAGAGGAQADALVTLAALTEADGDVAGSRERLRKARWTAERVGAIGVELRARHYLGLSFHDHGELTDALEVYQEGAARARETGLTWSDFGLELQAQRLSVLYALGEWDTLDGEVGKYSSGLPTVGAARTRAIFAHVAVARGDFVEGQRLVDYLDAQWRTDVQIAVPAGAAGAELASWRGDHAGAIRRVTEALDRLAEFEPWLLAGIRLGAIGIAAAADRAAAARLARNVDAEAAAVAEGEEFLAHVREVAVRGVPRTGELGPEGVAWLARADAEASRLRGKVEPDLWGKVVQAFDYGAVYEQAVCRWRYAEALLADARAQAAADELREVHAVAKRLGAVPLSDALTSLARRARVALPGNAAPRIATDPFTTRERAVLEQVALGRTNRQAGEALFISEKTVSVHLSRVMAKLGASRRTEAVAIAQDRGLLESPS